MSKENPIQRQWSRIINTMNDGLMIIGTDGTIILVNRALEEQTGYAAAEMIGNPCTLLRCDACEKTLRPETGNWCTLLDGKGKDMKRCRCRVMKKDGTWLPAVKNASVLRDDDGRVLGVVETLMDISELDRLEQKVDHLSRQLGEDEDFCGIIGRSAAIQDLKAVIRKAALSDAPVVIYGESGTGKELAARAIHQLGPRKNGPYIQCNCAALNASLLESELFGHVKGAFTGAIRHNIGRFEAADGGDIFLDEIGDVPMPVQVKLLRVLETKEFERVGDHRPLSVDVRIITATHRDLKTLMAQNRFREDLFFRINVIPIHLPPLRERVEDIPLLAETFIQRLNQRTGKIIWGLSRSAMDALLAYSWPGNVRELSNALEYAFVVAEGNQLERDHLPVLILAGDPNRAEGVLSMEKGASSEKTALIEALRQSGGNQSQAARLLGINRVTVWHRMKKYGIDLKRTIGQ